MKLFSDREACGTAAGPVGTVIEYAAGNTAGKPGMSKGSDITVNPDNDNFGEHAVTRKSEVANTAVSYTTGKSEVAAKNLTKETDMEALIKRAQEMKRKGDPEWKSVYASWKALREQQEQEIRKQRTSRDRQLDAAIDVLRESAKGSYKFWESRKWRLDRAMEILQQKGLEFRGGEVVPSSGKPGPNVPVHREPRWNEGQHHRAGEEQRKELRQFGREHTKVEVGT